MKIVIIPQSPVIFLGQKFTIQINVSDCDSTVQWISAQITGKTRTLNNQTNTLLHGIVKDALDGPQNAPFFGHVMSGSRLIAKDLTGSKSFCLSILVENIPPSYDGEGISIAYELMIACQKSSQIDKSHVFPIRFIAPFESSTSLQSCQPTASFTIDSSECSSFQVPFSLACPFSNNFLISTEPSEFIVKSESGTVATIHSPLGAFIGKDLTGIIDLSGSDYDVTNAKIKLIRSESYSSDPKANNTAVITQTDVSLAGLTMKRFNLLLPFTATANFTTDLVSVSYIIEFLLSSSKASWKWSSPFKLGPPEYALAKPRTPIQ